MSLIRWQHTAYAHLLDSPAVVELVEREGQDQLRHACTQCLCGGPDAPVVHEQGHSR